MRLLLAGLILVLVPILAEAQSEPTKDRGYDQEQLDKLNSNSRYDYDKEIKPSSSWLSTFFRQLANTIMWLFSGILGYVVVAVLIALLIWLVIKNTSSGKASLRRNKEGSDALQLLDKEELKAQDFDELLKDALANGQYRLAVRYMFLKSLKTLQLAELIDWHLEKTNRDYLNEVPEIHRSDFQQLISIYEFVWYGEFDAELTLVDKMDANLNRINKDIQR